jgi:hypothetical protein
MQSSALSEWISQGRPVPPPQVVKATALKEYGKRYALHVLVETGTYRGDMLEALRRDFDTIYSIELSAELFGAARDRFRNAKHIEIIRGDSGRVLASLVERLRRPALFWLDAHFSEGNTARGERDTPILQELGTILADDERRHVALVDDARCFGGDPAYPTLREFEDYVHSKRKDVDICVEDDILRVTPRI